MCLNSSFCTLQLTKTNRKILDANCLADAVRGCDTYASEKVLKGPISQALLRTAKWRQAPATTSQILFVAKRWRVLNKSDPSDGDSFPERLKNLTKGEAAYIITRLRHGAQRRYIKKIVTHRKSEAAEEKERQRQARVHVRVGPLVSTYRA